MTATTLDVSAAIPIRPSPARDAMRDVRDVSAGVVPFGLFVGITLTAYGEHPVGVLVGAAAVYGGSAQFAVLSDAEPRHGRQGHDTATDDLPPGLWVRLSVHLPLP